MVALRRPVTSGRRAFPPGALWFGTEAAAARYNCFPSLADVLTNLIFGIPLISYIDDFGALAPEAIGCDSLSPYKIPRDHRVLSA